MCTIGLAGEYKGKIGVNALWPKKTIGTAALQNIEGGREALKRSRKVDIMADSAYLIFKSNGKENSGNFYIDEDILKVNGITDLSIYDLREEDVPY